MVYFTDRTYKKFSRVRVHRFSPRFEMLSPLAHRWLLAKIRAGEVLLEAGYLNGVGTGVPLLCSQDVDLASKRRAPTKGKKLCVHCLKYLMLNILKYFLRFYD